MSLVTAPTPRYGHSAIWTGVEAIVWGGNDGVTDLDTGGHYDPVADTWAPTATVGAPGPRRFHTVVWTGTEMIVWGGEGHRSGGRYRP